MAEKILKLITPVIIQILVVVLLILSGQEMNLTLILGLILITGIAVYLLYEALFDAHKMLRLLFYVFICIMFFTLSLSTTFLGVRLVSLIVLPTCIYLIYKTV